MKSPKLIVGNVFSDARGNVFFNNEFDMLQIRRVYFIEHPDVSVIRAWQAHRFEQKWFQAVSGKFEVSLVKIDDWDNPSDKLPIIEFMLEAEKSEVLHIPEGYATGFKATESFSKLMVMSDFTLEESKNDDYRFPVGKWKFETK